MTLDEFKDLYFEKTDGERLDMFKNWIMEYDQEEHFFRRRLELRTYFKDLAELTGIVSTTV